MPRKRIATTEWVSRDMKDEVEKAVRNKQECRLCDFQTCKRHIWIHIRQHLCMHYCHCGYRHVSRDQVVEHQRLTRRPGHARSKCQIHMVSSEQYPAFRKAMGWATNKTFRPLLPTTKSQSPVAVTSRPSTSSEMPREKPKVIEI